MPLVVTPTLLRQRAELYQQLGSLLAAGVGLVPALDIIGRNCPAARFRGPLAVISARLQAGHTFAEALAAQPGWLPPFDLALIAAGEQSGRLVECARLLAQHYDERARLARGVVADLAYPLVVAHLAVFVFPPTLLADLVRSGDVLGFLLTKALWLAPVYGVVAAGILACQGQRAEAWRSAVERLLAPVPFVGAARRELALARLAAALEALINAGVSIIEGWRLAADAGGSPALRRAVARWHGPLQGGATPGELVGRSPEFPELFAGLYLTGETSGQLDETLRRLQAHYQEEGTRHLRLVAQWAPRLVYFAVLLSVAYFVVSFWAGYYRGMMNLYDF